MAKRKHKTLALTYIDDVEFIRGGHSKFKIPQGGKSLILFLRFKGSINPVS